MFVVAYQMLSLNAQLSMGVMGMAKTVLFPRRHNFLSWENTGFLNRESLLTTHLKNKQTNKNLWTKNPCLLVYQHSPNTGVILGNWRVAFTVVLAIRRNMYAFFLQPFLRGQSDFSFTCLVARVWLALSSLGKLLPLLAAQVSSVNEGCESLEEREACSSNLFLPCLWSGSWLFFWVCSSGWHLSSGKISLQQSVYCGTVAVSVLLFVTALLN